jgi:protein TonB
MTAVAFSDPASRRWGRWLGAAAAVTTLHATALALAIVGFEPEEIVEEPEGSVMLELAPMPVSAAPDTINMPPTPIEAAALSTTKTLEPAQPENELFEVEPSPLAPDPEVAVPVLKPVEEVTETEEPDPEPPIPDDPAPAEMAVPQVTTPPPTLAATPSPTTAAREQGTTAQAARKEASWQKQIVTELGKHRRYPDEARPRREQGGALVRFTLDREGRIVASAVVESSGSRLLDAEALEVLTRAAPLPAPPDELEGATFDLELPIRFRIRGN